MKFYLLQNLEENEVDKYMTKHKLVTHIALVLDLLVPVDVVDGVGNLVGGLGDGDLGLDDTKDDEDLTIGDRIECEQTVSLCSLVRRGSAVAATVRAGNSALHSRRCSISSVNLSPSWVMKWATLSLMTWNMLAEISSWPTPVDTN